MAEPPIQIAHDPSEAVWNRLVNELRELLEGHLIGNSEPTIEAMSYAILKRIESDVPFSINERIALIGLYKQVAIALDLLPKAGV